MNVIARRAGTALLVGALLFSSEASAQSVGGSAARDLHLRLDFAARASEQTRHRGAGAALTLALASGVAAGVLYRQDRTLTIDLGVLSAGLFAAGVWGLVGRSDVEELAASTRDVPDTAELNRRIEAAASDARTARLVRGAVLVAAGLVLGGAALTNASTSNRYVTAERLAIGTTAVGAGAVSLYLSNDLVELLR